MQKFLGDTIKLSCIGLLAAGVAACGAEESRTGPPNTGADGPQQDEQSSVPLQFEYVEVSDGTQIAVSVYFPPGYSENDIGTWPSLLQMDGYGGAGGTIDNSFYGTSDKYVVVYASVRGTGCSGGQFEVFSDRSAQDGYEIIEDWMVKQPWSNGVVGITGQSYSGITGLHVATTNPPHLEAVAVSGLIGDLYRGILYRGGIVNPGFPAVWTAVFRPQSEIQDNQDEYLNDPTCLANISERRLGNLGGDAAVTIAEVLSQPYATPDSWAVRKSLYQKLENISVPIEIHQQNQDESTGPRGAYSLWRNLPEEVPKRFILANGGHNPFYNNPHNVEVTKGAWFDCWLINAGQGCGQVNAPEHRVVTFYERRVTDSGIETGALYTSSDWPLPETQWTRYYLRADGELSTQIAGGDGERRYISAPMGRQITAQNADLGSLTLTEGLDGLIWRLRFEEDTALNGPITVSFWASATSVESDFFVGLVEYFPETGQIQYLQRGQLRGSLREVDPQASYRVASGPEAGSLAWLHHPFDQPDPLVPGSVYKFELEVFPISHVFRAGQELQLRLHAPPLVDPASQIDVYGGLSQPVVTVLQDAEHRSSVLLPVMPELPTLHPTPPACGELYGIRCYSP